MGTSILDNELKELIMLYVTGNLGEKQFRAAYRRLIRLQALLNRR